MFVQCTTLPVTHQTTPTCISAITTPRAGCLSLAHTDMYVCTHAHVPSHTPTHQFKQEGDCSIHVYGLHLQVEQMTKSSKAFFTRGPHNSRGTAARESGVGHGVSGLGCQRGRSWTLATTANKQDKDKDR